MTYLQLSYLHLATILPAFALASFLLLVKKGTKQHKSLGKIYMVLMLITASISLFMPAEVGPRLLNHFGFIHILSFSVFYFVPAAYFAIKAGNVLAHKGNMLGLYVGGLLVAGTFAMMPGRLLYSWLF